MRNGANGPTTPETWVADVMIAKLLAFYWAVFIEPALAAISVALPSLAPSGADDEPTFLCYGHLEKVLDFLAGFW